MLDIKAESVEAIRERFARAPRTADDYIQKNLKTLGGKLASVMRRVLKPVRYTGELEGSVAWHLEAKPPFYTLIIGPSAKERVWVRFGTRAHWAPIGPLKQWAAVKLGDPNAAYAVQRSIARHGTSVWIERRGLGDGSGGYDYVGRTLAAGDAALALQRTGERIPLEIANAIRGESA